MAAHDEPIDGNTRRWLRAVGRPLTVLADPSYAATRPSADLPRLRTLAGDVRQHTLDHLDKYLDAARSAVEAAGGHVHSAVDAAAARRLVSELTSAQLPALVVRSAVCDEVGLPAASPAAASVAVVGVSFIVAETGLVCMASDDPAVAAAAQAPVLVCLAGIEAIVPRTGDLAIMLKLLARASTGRPMTAYTALLGAAAGRRRAFHLILLDNGRREVLAGEHQSVLRCIGCGACTNVCPVYRAADVAPAGLWAGPIGAIVRPLLQADAAHLPHASSLCGACAAACPVRIDLPAHLIALRSRSPVMVARLRLWAWVMLSPARYRWATRWMTRWHGRGYGRWPAAAARSFHDLWRRQGNRR